MDLPAISDGDRFAILLRPGYLPVPRRPVFRLRISSTDNYIPNSSLQKNAVTMSFPCLHAANFNVLRGRKFHRILLKPGSNLT